MRQRVMIAIAIACDPQLLIADEPTTALDVTIQAQIIELLREIAGRIGTAIMLITHDLGVVAGMCRRVQVMYAGRSLRAHPDGHLRGAPCTRTRTGFWTPPRAWTARRRGSRQSTACRRRFSPARGLCLRPSLRVGRGAVLEGGAGRVMSTGGTGRRAVRCGEQLW